MKITSRASDYALLLMIYLSRLDKEETASIKTVAAHHRISLRFLANIANKLSVAHLLESTRGINGGVRLARSARQISVSEVIEAVDGPIQTMFCQNTHEMCNFEGLCQMKSFWDGIQGDVMKKLNRTKIQDLARMPERAKSFVL